VRVVGRKLPCGSVTRLPCYAQRKAGGEDELGQLHRHAQSAYLCEHRKCDEHSPGRNREVIHHCVRRHRSDTIEVIEEPDAIIKGAMTCHEALKGEKASRRCHRQRRHGRQDRDRRDRGHYDRGRQERRSRGRDRLIMPGRLASCWALRFVFNLKLQSATITCVSGNVAL
jgi:hypothetical protein